MALKTGKIRTIGIVVPQINRTYFVEAIAGVERELYKAGYDLIIASTGNLYERERNIVDSLSNGKVIGVIAAVAAETTDYSHYQRLIDNNIPVVFLIVKYLVLMLVLSFRMIMTPVTTRQCTSLSKVAAIYSISVVLRTCRCGVRGIWGTERLWRTMA